jgi:hypothetical protein
MELISRNEVARSMDRRSIVYLLRKALHGRLTSPEIDVLQEAHLNNLRRLGEEWQAGAEWTLARFLPAQR